MFTSASLAAVTTVVMFLLTYMPYIIVIAMEANMSLGYKIIIVCMNYFYDEFVNSRTKKFFNCCFSALVCQPVFHTDVFTRLDEKSKV